MVVAAWARRPSPGELLSQRLDPIHGRTVLLRSGTRRTTAVDACTMVCGDPCCSQPLITRFSPRNGPTQGAELRRCPRGERVIAARRRLRCYCAWRFVRVPLQSDYGRRHSSLHQPNPPRGKTRPLLSSSLRFLPFRPGWCCSLRVLVTGLCALVADRAVDATWRGCQPCDESYRGRPEQQQLFVLLRSAVHLQ